MKYKLKRDLPFANIEDNVRVNNYEDVIMIDSTKYGEKTICYQIGRFDDLPDLLGNGWIEEVKPREFWVGLDKQGLITSDCIADNKEYFIDGRKYFPAVIKVREVLE